MKESENFSEALETELSEPTDIKTLFPEALKYLDSVCDGAITDDAVGFAGTHTGKGKKLAANYRNAIPFTTSDVNWIYNSLSYYFNTQLSWIDREDWKLAYNYEYTKASETEADLLEELKKLENFLLSATSDQLKLLLKAINLKAVARRDTNFIKSLQNWQRFYSWKQVHMMKKFILNYSHTIPQSVKDEVLSNHD